MTIRVQTLVWQSHLQSHLLEGLCQLWFGTRPQIRGLAHDVLVLPSSYTLLRVKVHLHGLIHQDEVA